MWGRLLALVGLYLTTALASSIAYYLGGFLAASLVAALLVLATAWVFSRRTPKPYWRVQS